MFSNIQQHYQVMMGHSKTLKMRFWMIQSAKKEDFGRFLDLGQLDRLETWRMALDALILNW